MSVAFAEPRRAHLDPVVPVAHGQGCVVQARRPVLGQILGVRALLVDQHGWTLLTAINLMLFSLLHNPCATTIITIYKETLSRKWTAIGALMPLAIAFLVTFVVATLWRLLSS